MERHLLTEGTDKHSAAGEAVMRADRDREKPTMSKPLGIRAWEKDVLRVRAWIENAGRPWADERPMAGAQLGGLAGTERQRSLLDLAPSLPLERLGPTTA